MNRKRAAVCAAIMCCVMLPRELSAEDEDANQTVIPEKPGTADYAISYGETTLINSLFFLFNRFVSKEDWAYVTPESIGNNLTGPWGWDQNTFAVNHLGHPYQGSLYYSTARANNIGFWGSALTTALGSVTWELFGETEQPSINDLRATTLGGIALGEILHRLYGEAAASGFLLAGLISPADILNELLTGTRHQAPVSRLIYADFQIHSGTILSHINFEDDYYGKEDNLFPLILSAGSDLVYGYPYGVSSKEPFSHFELQGLCDYRKDYYSLWFFSDGYLRAFDPAFCNTAKTASTAAISLHYDVIFSSDINYSANSVGFTFKQLVECSPELVFQWKLHINWLMLGASDYYYLRDAGGKNGEEIRSYDFGTGENIKLYLSLSHKRWGRLAAQYNVNGIHTIPAAVQAGGSNGYTIIGLADVRYEHRLRGQYYWGLSFTSYHKNGFYDDAPDVNHHVRIGRVYLRKTLVNRSSF